MMYESIGAYLEDNMKSAYDIAEKLNEEDKEELTQVLDFLKYKIMEYNDIMKWHESAVRETVSDEQYDKIVKLFMAYMHNDFIVNTEIGKEMLEKGFVKPSSMKFIADFK